MNISTTAVPFRLATAHPPDAVVLGRARGDSADEQGRPTQALIARSLAWSASLLASKGELLLGSAWTPRYQAVFYAMFCVLILSRTAGVLLLALWLVGIVMSMLAGSVIAGVPDLFFGSYNMQFFFGMVGVYRRCVEVHARVWTAPMDARVIHLRDHAGDRHGGWDPGVALDGISTDAAATRPGIQGRATRRRVNGARTDRISQGSWRKTRVCAAVPGRIRAC
jgi:hypothetical protein